MTTETEKTTPEYKNLRKRIEEERLFIDWLRQTFAETPKKTVDVDKLILGRILDSVLGDDEICFVWAKIAGFDSTNALMYQKILGERLRWEIETPEVPKKIRSELQKTLQAIEPLNWANQRDYQEAHQVWLSMRDWVKQQKEQTPVLRKAVKDYTVCSSFLKKQFFESSLYKANTLEVL